MTAWLVLMIVANAGTAVFTPFAIPGLRQAGLDPSPIGVAVIVVCALANVAFAVALLRWKKWGFYGFVATSVVALVANFSLGLGIGQSLLGLIGIAILYGILQIGGANKAWPRLK